MLAAVCGVLVLAVLGYIVRIVLATVHTARSSGTVAGLPLDAPARIVRDERGIPHIRAATLHDLFFAQGYATGSDRLFQIDLTRRYVYGRLSELLGSVAIGADIRSRVYDPASVIAAELRGLTASDRAELDAYAEGVNAAAQREPVPPEYRVLLARFTPWQPQDTLACGIAIVRDLSDGWDDVILRDDVIRAVGPGAASAFFPLSDPAYDVPTTGGPHMRIAPLPPLAGRHLAATAAAAATAADPDGGARGSNAFAAGAARTAGGRALLANDPHLDRSMPGIWHLVDLAAPGYHVAGATLAGTPGVVLGHNAWMAWGATNGTVAGPRVYRETFASETGDTYAAAGRELRATVRLERFAVRFGGIQTRRYLATRHGFVVEASGRVRHAVNWDVVTRPIAALSTFGRLSRAHSVADGVRILAGYPGPTQNFVLADVGGRVGYALAGAIPDGPWGLTAAAGATTDPAAVPLVPFEQLPRVAPSRAAVVVTANNLQYGAGYPYRLSAEYSAPYRAAEITRRLHRLTRFDAAAFAAIQADTASPAELELARLTVAALRARGADHDPELVPAFAALAAFDGRFQPASRGATVVERLRLAAAADLAAAHLPAALSARYMAPNARFVLLMRALREHPRGWFAGDDPDAFLVAELRAVVRRFGRDAVAVEYGEADAVTAAHPLAPFGFSLWNGPRVAGQGGRYAPAVQGASIGQSFRAVWDVGNWDAGGIDIPLGESGEPGSPHYRDLAARYARHVLTALPFSDAAVARAARTTLVLER